MTASLPLHLMAALSYALISTQQKHIKLNGKAEGSKIQTASTVEIQYIMCKTLQPQSHYRIAQDIYTCRETMNTTQ